KARFQIDLAWLATETLEMFHRYSFATLRQFGACYELAATYLRWLGQYSGRDFDVPIRIFTEIATDAKTLQFQFARAVARKRTLDAITHPAQLENATWLLAVVPGTVAAALSAAERWSLGQPLDADAHDWWYRTTFAAPQSASDRPCHLCLDGLATLAEVWLNGQ